MSNYFGELSIALQALDPDTLQPLVRVLQQVRARRSTVYICGNGGSYTNALHWATDLAKVARLRTYVLGANAGLLTALSNDMSYEKSLSQELSMMLMPGDVLIVLSVSGASPNIKQAIASASTKNVQWFIITTRDSPYTSYNSPSVILVPSCDYGVVEDCHAAIGHWLTKELSS